MEKAVAVAAAPAVGPDGTIYTGNENWMKAYHPDGNLKWTFTQNPRAFVFIMVLPVPAPAIIRTGPDSRLPWLTWPIL